MIVLVLTQDAFIERGYAFINDGEGDPFVFTETETEKTT